MMAKMKNWSCRQRALKLINRNGHWKQGTWLFMVYLIETSTVLENACNLYYCMAFKIQSSFIYILRKNTNKIPTEDLQKTI